MPLFIGLQRILDSLRIFDFLAPLGFRLLLMMVFWEAGMRKIDGLMEGESGFVNLIASMGFPEPVIFAWLAAITEALGAILLAAGLAVRWVSLPLLFVMGVAAFGVHWGNGWLAIADGRDPEIAERLAKVRETVDAFGYPNWVYAKGAVGHFAEWHSVLRDLLPDATLIVLHWSRKVCQSGTIWVRSSFMGK